MGVAEVTHDEAVDVTYSNITDIQVIIQVSNLGIVDLGTVNLGTTVVKRKIITISEGVAILANTTTSTAIVNINNLNIYNRTILLEDLVIHFIKREIQNLLKLLSNPYYKNIFKLLFKGKSIFKVVVLASPGLVE